MSRRDSQNQQFKKRIPADILPVIVGRTIELPVGDRTQRITITPQMEIIRLSLRTNDPAEVKARNAAIDARLSMTYAALRQNTPVRLDRRQATALAGELYRAWGTAASAR